LSNTARHISGLPYIFNEVGKIANNGMVSVFTKEGVKIFKEKDVLIPRKGKPILIGI
jgi:hypothetical protein